MTLQVYKKEEIKGSKILSFGTTDLEDIDFQHDSAISSSDHSLVKPIFKNYNQHVKPLETILRAKNI